MLCRRLFLAFALFCSFSPNVFAKAEENAAEKMIYVSLDIVNGNDLLRSRIMKELLLQLSLVKKTHFIMLSEGQGKTLASGFKEIYYLRLEITLNEKADIAFTLFDEKAKKIVKKVSKSEILKQKLFTLSKAGMRLVISPLLE